MLLLRINVDAQKSQALFSMVVLQNNIYAVEQFENVYRIYSYTEILIEIFGKFLMNRKEKKKVFLKLQTRVGSEFTSDYSVPLSSTILKSWWLFDGVHIGSWRIETLHFS